MAIGDKALGDKARGGMAGKMGANRDAVAARKAASVAAGAAAGAPKGGPVQTGFGVMGNTKVGAGAGLKSRSKGIAAAMKAGGVRGAAKALREMSGRKKPSGMY